MKLYEINEAIRTVMESVDEETGEIAEVQFEQLTALEMAFEEKVENVAFVVRELGAEAKAIEEEARRLAAKARTRASEAKGLKGYLKDQLAARGVRKVKGRLLTVRLQKSAPSVAVNDESLIPKRFWITPAPVLAKGLLRDTLKLGEEVAGAELHQSEHVRIV